MYIYMYIYIYIYIYRYRSRSRYRYRYTHTHTHTHVIVDIGKYRLHCRTRGTLQTPWRIHQVILRVCSVCACVHAWEKVSIKDESLCVCMYFKTIHISMNSYSYTRVRMCMWHLCEILIYFNTHVNWVFCTHTYMHICVHVHADA